MRHFAALLLFLALSPLPAQAFVCLKAANGNCLHWNQGQATLLSFLGGPVQLANGTNTWDQNAIDAANDWNAVGAAFHFNAAVGSQLNEPCGPPGPNHACPNTGPPGDNPIVFRSDLCGVSFGPDIIELTKNCWNQDGSMVNAPVFVNSRVLWNAYNGPIQFTTSGVPINDIRRVLLHEFGHVLGLDHPDLNGQNVQAIMNSQESDLYQLQADDIAGIRFLYPNAGPAPTSGCHISDGGSSAGWMLVLPGLLLVLRRHPGSGGRPSIRRQQRAATQDERFGYVASITSTIHSE